MLTVVVDGINGVACGSFQKAVRIYDMMIFIVILHSNSIYIIHSHLIYYLRSAFV